MPEEQKVYVCAFLHVQCVWLTKETDAFYWPPFTLNITLPLEETPLQIFLLLSPEGVLENFAFCIFAQIFLPCPFGLSHAWAGTSTP